MKKQDKHQINNPQPVIEDLTVNEDQAAEVKGGPIYMKIEGVYGDSTADGHNHGS